MNTHTSKVWRNVCSTLLDTPLAVPASPAPPDPSVPMQPCRTVQDPFALAQPCCAAPDPLRATVPHAAPLASLHAEPLRAAPPAMAPRRWGRGGREERGGREPGTQPVEGMQGSEWETVALSVTNN